MITGNTLTGEIPSVDTDRRPDRPHWQDADTARREALAAECAKAARRVRRAAAQRRLDRAQKALEGLSSVHIAILLRESREGMDAAADPIGDIAEPDPDAWHHHAMAAVVLLRECSRRRGHPEPRYVAWLDQVEAALDAGDLYDSMVFPTYGVRAR